MIQLNNFGLIVAGVLHLFQVHVDTKNITGTTLTYQILQKNITLIVELSIIAGIGVFH